MVPIIPKQFEKYCEQHSVVEPALFQELAKETYEKMQAPQMQVGHLEGIFLRLLARLVNARRILEIGTFTGYSALMMAEALPEDGVLTTCDIDPKATELAQRYWDKSPHGKKITLRLGPALETLKRIEGPLDLVFLDADKENYIKYWEACVPKVRKGGLLLADNVLWNGRVLNPQDPTDYAIIAFNKHVKQDPRVEPVMLPVRDGITMAYKI